MRPDPSGGISRCIRLQATIWTINCSHRSPRSQFSLLVPHLTTATLAQGTVVFETGDQVDQVYFPHNGMFSLLAVMRDGKAIETATVGREGVVGAMAGLGLYNSRYASWCSFR